MTYVDVQYKRFLKKNKNRTRKKKANEFEFKECEFESYKKMFISFAKIGMILTVCIMLAIVSKDLCKFFFEAEFEAL